MTKRHAVVGGLAALAVVPAAAFASAPTKDGNYSALKKGRSVASLHVSKDGKKVDSFSAYGKCNPVPFNPPVSMKINKSGVFNLTGNAKDVLGKKHRVVVHGKFTSATTAVGDVKVDGPGCKGKVVKFTAVLSGTGGGNSGV